MERETDLSQVLGRTLLDATLAVIEQIDRESAARFRKRIREADSVFVAGAGRTGYIARCFAMRLMHLGLPVHVVGEATAPAPTSRDILLAFSGSGETLSTCEVASRASGLDIPIFAITTSPGSPLARSARDTLVIPAESSQYPLGTLFEAVLFAFLDATALALKEELGVSEKDMSSRHALG